MMEVYRGKVIVGGNAIGRILTYTRNHYQVDKKAIKQLESAYEKAVEIVGARNAAVFDIQAMLLREGKLG